MKKRNQATTTHGVQGERLTDRETDRRTGGQDD